MRTFVVCSAEEHEKNKQGEQWGYIVNATTEELAIDDVRRSDDYRPGTGLVAVEITDENATAYGLA
jgi:hypothetical protein